MFSCSPCQADVSLRGHSQDAVVAVTVVECSMQVMLAVYQLLLHAGCSYIALGEGVNHCDVEGERMTLKVIILPPGTLPV